VGDKAIYCGEVNSKNSFGGLAGFSKYVVVERAVFIGNDGGLVYDVDDQSPHKADSVSAAMQLKIMQLRADTANIEVKLQQLKAHAENPSLGSQTALEAAWSEYCAGKSEAFATPVLSTEETCKREFEAAKALYSQQLTDKNYSEASNIKVPNTCRPNVQVGEEVKLMATNAEVQRLLTTASDPKGFPGPRSAAIADIKEKFPQLAAEHRTEIVGWEASIAKADKRRR
jgi:hypothetical protein